MADMLLPAPNGTNGHADAGPLTAESLRAHTNLLRRIIQTRDGITFGGRRDSYETLGYLRDLRYEDYYERYCRGGIAARIIDAFPAATWRLPPVIREKGKADETQQSPFEQQWESLAMRLRVWKELARADRLASLGNYSVLLLGLRNQLDWAATAQPVRTAEDIVYLKSYSQDHATILELVSNDKTALFGQPQCYAVDFSRRISQSLIYSSTLRPSLGDAYGSLIPVHASRLVHIAENGLDDDIVGTPRLQAVWNYLDDLAKVVGGSGEMFWQDAKRRIVLSMAGDAHLDPESDTAKNLSAEVDEFVHELRNFLRVQGITVTQLEGRIPDPSGHVDKLLDLIAGTVGMPKRKLVGSERGELASSQDENNWNATIMERQQQHAEPILLRPLIDRCILLHALPRPAGGYVIEWPNLLAKTDKDRAEEAHLWSQTLSEYAGPGGMPRDVLPLEIFFADIVGFDSMQVQRILALLGEVRAQQQTMLAGDAGLEGVAA